MYTLPQKICQAENTKKRKNNHRALMKKPYAAAKELLEANSRSFRKDFPRARITALTSRNSPAM
jgi:hypothetical protein